MILFPTAILTVFFLHLCIPASFSARPEAWSIYGVRKQKDNFTACENYAAAHHFCLTSALSTCIRLTSVRQEPPAVPPDQRWRSHCCYRQLQQPCESVSSLAAAASQDLPGKTVAQQHEKQLKHKQN